MTVAHLTTVASSLRYLLAAQLTGVAEMGGRPVGISAPGPEVADLEESGIRHFSLPASTRSMSLSADVRAIFQLWRILRSQSIDILHTHNPKPGLYGRVVGRVAGVPVVVNTVHGLYATDDDRWTKRLLVYVLEAVASRFSDAELVQSREDMQRMIKWRISPRSKTIHLGNGVDLRRFSPRPDRSVVRTSKLADVGVSPSTVVVGCVARLVEEKGIRELVEAYRHSASPYALIVIGPDDPEKSDAIDEQFLAAAARAGVRFLGHRADVEDWYQVFDIFVLPSYREGFPRAAMEAAASGVPVIATDIRGCREVVDDGVNGLLVPVKDPAALGRAIDALVSDERRRSRMRLEGRRKAEADFDEDAIVRTVLNVYQTILQRKESARRREGPKA